MKIKDQNNRANHDRRVREKAPREQNAGKKDTDASSFRDLLRGKNSGEKKPPEGRLAAEKQPSDGSANELFRAEREDTSRQNTALHERQQSSEMGARDQRTLSFQDMREVQKHETRDASRQRLEQRHEDRLTEHREAPGEARAHDPQDSSNPAERASPGASRRAGDDGDGSPSSPAKKAASEGGDPSSLAAEKALEAVGEKGTSSAARGEEVGQASSPEQARRQEIAEIANKLVRACQVGQDQQARKVMMLDVRVPGRGSIRVRLRQEGSGISVRMRADNDALKSLLRKHQGAMRDSANEQGVAFTRIDVV